jgi:hypothetical protein
MADEALYLHCTYMSGREREKERERELGIVHWTKSSGPFFLLLTFSPYPNNRFRISVFLDFYRGVAHDSFLLRHDAEILNNWTSKFQGNILSSRVKMCS